MKGCGRSVFTIVLLFQLIAVHSLRAQALYHFPQPGLKQVEIHHSDWTDGGGLPHNESFYYAYDTIVGSYTISKFVFYYPNNNYYQFYPFYTYYDSGKVYVAHTYNINSFFSNPTTGQLLYDFSLNVGDTISLTSGYWIYGSYTVDSTGSILLANGQTRKYMRLHNGNSVVKWIDAIGDIEHGIFYESDWEGGREEFVCQEDSTGHVYDSPITTYLCNSTHPYISSSGNDTCNVFSFSTNVIPTVSCYCSGQMSVWNVHGGTPPYTYLWSNGSTATYVNQTCAGNYFLTITDANNVSCSRAFYLGIEPAITVTVSSVTTNCIGEGSVCVIPYGGSAPYTYSWSPSGNTQSCVTNLFSGTYTVCVEDMNGCQTCIPVVVPNYSPPTATTTQTTPSCISCCDGNIIVHPTGGAPPYIITHPNQTWPAPGNFCCGTYRYCVTDSNGCSFCDSTTLSILLSVSKLETGNSFSVYPNPTTDLITFDFGNEIPPETKIVLCDITGRLMNGYSPPGTGNTFTVKTDLPDGMYFYKVMTGSITRSSGKIVVLK